MEGAARPALNRVLPYAILGSLALHGMLLFGLSMEREAAKGELPLPTLEARLIEPPAAAPPKVEPVKPPPPRPVAKPKPRPRPKPAPLAKAIPEAPPAEAAPAEPSPEPAAAPAAPPPSVARVEPRPGPPAPSAGELEARERDAYRRAVMDAARRHNRYPPLARENNWEGEVQVGLMIGADGRVSLTINRSSKHAVLDRQALEMFKQAQAQVPLPETLRGKEVRLELRAIYNLRDQASG
jgi:periplasmic protein TonB